jgi:cell division protein FtsB
MPRPLRLLRPRLRVRWLALAVLALIALLYTKPIRSYLGTRAQLQRRTAEVQALRAQKLALERRLVQAASGEELVRQARRLGLVKPGERLFIVKGIAAWRHAQAAAPARR